MRRAWQGTLAIALALSCTPLDPSGLKVQVLFPRANTPRIQAIPDATRAVPILVMSEGQVLDKVVLTSQAPSAVFRGLPLGQVEVYAAAYDRSRRPLAIGKARGLIQQNQVAKTEVDLQQLTAENLPTLQALVDHFEPFLDLVGRILETFPVETESTSATPVAIPSDQGSPPSLNPGTQPPTASGLKAISTPRSGFPTVLTATVSDPDSAAFVYTLELQSGSRAVSYRFDGANWILTAPSIIASAIPLVPADSGTPEFYSPLSEGSFGRPGQSGNLFSVVWLAPTVAVSTSFTVRLKVSDGAQTATSNDISVSLTPLSTRSGSANVGF